MSDLKERLRVLDQAGTPELWPQLWEEATTRRTHPSVTLGLPVARPRARLAAVALAAVVSVAATGFLWHAFAGSHTQGGTLPQGSLGGPAPTSPPPPPSFDGWLVSVSVKPSSVGPLHISTAFVTGVSKPGWIEHTLTFTNVGIRTVFIDDLYNGSPFQGAPSRELALSGLGFCSGWFAAKGVHPPPKLAYQCVSMLVSPVKLGPGESVTRVVALYKGLKGMSPLVPGRYEFPLAFSTWVKPIRLARTPLPWTVRCNLSYLIKAA